MRLVHALAPLALLSTSACEFFPANSPADFAGSEPSQEASDPSAREITLASYDETVAAWQLPPESPWARYEKLTLLTYLSNGPVTATLEDVSALPEVRRAEMAAAHVARAGLPEHTLWVVDLHGAASVAFGVTLSQMSRAPVAPVMTFNNWPAENEVIPAEQALAALATMRPKLPSPEDTGQTPVFLLDAYRLSDPYGEPDPVAIDNRYMLFPADFPDAATLRAQGITQVVYVVDNRGERSTEQDDLHDVATAYQAEGIALCLVDLADLQRFDADAEDRWDGYLPMYRLSIGARVTIFSDPVFYSRARGGFGGVRAVPGGVAHPRVYSFAHPTVAGFHSSGHSGGGHAGGHFGGGRVFSGASPHVGGHGGG